MIVPFNKPFTSGKEVSYILEVMEQKKLSGNGKFTKRCQQFFTERYGFNKCLLTASCTDALEMAALLLDVEPGDEIIVPSFTFVSTANPFVLRGAKIVFADSTPFHPNIDETKIEALIGKKTKAIVVIHYAGLSCNMEAMMSLAEKYGLFVVEDAALAIDSYHINTAGRKQWLGGIGHLGAFSFHETKNVTSGEGGLLVVNDERFSKKAEVIWEKGTNRSAFFRGEVDKYGWVDIGSSFLPSEITAAFLYAQLEHLEPIQCRRVNLWNRYFSGFERLETQKKVFRPVVPEFAAVNGNTFYLVLPDLETRAKLIEHLKSKGITAVFHYSSLHKSPFYKLKHDGRQLPNADRFSDCLLRLPLYYELSDSEVEYVIQSVYEFFG